MPAPATTGIRSELVAEDSARRRSFGKRSFAWGLPLNSATGTLTLDAVARRLQTTRLNLLLHIKHGLLPATEHQGDWSIREEDLQAFLARTQTAEPGALCASSGCGNGCGSCAKD